MSTISLPVLQTVRAIIENRYGFAYTDDQLPLLRDRLLAAGGRDGRTLDAMLASLQRGPGGDDADLVQSLTIGETYFFRNSAQYDAIRAVVLPRLLSALGSSGILTVWSAGCATGEEPYSLAILIREAAPQLWPSRVRILATDLNADFLQRAQEGRYTRWSLRQRDEDFVARHFQTQGSTFVVDSRLRDVISFQEHNLQSGRLPAGIGVGQVSLLLCRNVLIYFSQQAWSRALDLFGSALHGDGVMFLGHSETMARHQCWRTQYHPGTFFYLIPQPETPPKAAAQASAPVKVDPEPLPPTRSREVHPCQSSDGADDGVRGLEGPEGGGLLERARAAADAGQWEDAWRDLKVVLAQDKTCVEGHLLAALVADELARWPEERLALRRAVFLDRGLVVAHYLLAMLDDREGHLTAAARGYRTVGRLLTDIPSEADIPSARGLNAGRLREMAAVRSQELERTNPKEPLVHVN